MSMNRPEEPQLSTMTAGSPDSFLHCLDRTGHKHLHGHGTLHHTLHCTITLPGHRRTIVAASRPQRQRGNNVVRQEVHASTERAKVSCTIVVDPITRSVPRGAPTTVTIVLGRSISAQQVNVNDQNHNTNPYRDIRTSVVAPITAVCEVEASKPLLFSGKSISAQQEPRTGSVPRRRLKTATVLSRKPPLHRSEEEPPEDNTNPYQRSHHEQYAPRKPVNNQMFSGKSIWAKQVKKKPPESQYEPIP